MMKIESWKLDKIKPYFQNAKKHNVEWIAASIKNFKPDQPIVVDGEGVIIKGHGRLKAAKEIGLKEFPVVVRTDLTPEQVRLSRIADNRSGEGGWDVDALAFELGDIDMSDIDFNLEDMGIDQDWLDDLGVDDSGGDKEKKESGGGEEQLKGYEYQVIVSCSGEDQQIEIITELEERGLKCRPLIL